ncbi:hypothetical protein GCM10009551_033080 [Nocardiopsis tropica]
MLSVRGTHARGPLREARTGSGMGEKPIFIPLGCPRTRLRLRQREPGTGYGRGGAGAGGRGSRLARPARSAGPGRRAPPEQAFHGGDPYGGKPWPLPDKNPAAFGPCAVGPAPSREPLPGAARV